MRFNIDFDSALKFIYTNNLQMNKIIKRKTIIKKVEFFKAKNNICFVLFYFLFLMNIFLNKKCSKLSFFPYFQQSIRKKDLFNRRLHVIIGTE